MKIKLLSCAILLINLVLMQQTTAQSLQSHASVVIQGSVFTYTLYNDEPASSNNYLYEFSLATRAPFTVVGTPVGWGYDTDNQTYIDWINEDTSFPSAYDVAPGVSLPGFVIDATGPVEANLQSYGVESYDHSNNTSGPSTDEFHQVLAPTSAPAMVPEPSSFVSLGVGMLLLGATALIARKRTRKSAS